MANSVSLNMSKVSAMFLITPVVPLTLITKNIFNHRLIFNSHFLKVSSLALTALKVFKASNIALAKFTVVWV